MLASRALTTTARAAARLGSLLAVAATLHELVNLRALREPPADPPDVDERVSILVPARDEAHRIALTVRALLAQRGVPDLEVLVLDDGSSDGTAEVVLAAAADDPRLRLIPGAALPPGWLGKPHACAQLAAAARGRVLVFVDADVRLAGHAVASAVALLRGTEADLVSPFPRQLADTPATRLVQPLLPWSWLVLLPLRRAESSPRPTLSAANGQFLLVDAAALARAGGFAAIAGEVLDDMALVRAVKRSGGRAVLANGAGIAECRMYDSWAELSAGYRKSLWSAFGRAPAAVAALLVLLWVVPALAALTGSRLALVGYGAGVLSRALAAARTGGRVWPDAAAHPVSVAVLVGLLARSRHGYRRGALTWKGRSLAAAAGRRRER